MPSILLLYSWAFLFGVPIEVPFSYKVLYAVGMPLSPRILGKCATSVLMHVHCILFDSCLCAAFAVHYVDV